MLRLSLTQERSHIDSVQILSDTHHIHDFDQVLTFHPRIKKGKQNICGSFYHLCLIILRSVLNLKESKTLTTICNSSSPSPGICGYQVHSDKHTYIWQTPYNKIKASTLINCVGAVYMHHWTFPFLTYTRWSHHCLNTTEHTLSDCTPKSNGKAYCLLPVHKTTAWYCTKHCRQL